MPGFGMHMGLGMHQEQRLSLRQELKLSQTLTLSIAQIQTFRTKGEESLQEQTDILEKLFNDVRNHAYADWRDFHNRCMKRIKKEDRTQSVKEIIGYLRGIIVTTQPSLEEIRKLLATGLYAAKNHEIPNVVYAHMHGLLDAPSAQTLEDKVDVIRLGDSLERNNGNLTLVYELLHRTAEDERFASGNYPHVFSRVKKLAEQKADMLRLVNNHFERILEERENLDGDVIGHVFNYLEKLYELSRENVTSAHTSDAKEMLKREDFKELVVRYPHIPLPILANLLGEGLGDNVMQRANGICEHKYLTGSTDPQRRVFRSLYSLNANPEKRKVLEHLLTNISSAEHVSKILGHLELLQETGNFFYFFDETDGSNMIKKLSSYGINRNLAMLGLSEEHKRRVAEEPQRVQSGNLLTMISTYGGVLLSSHKDGIPLLREITEHVIDGDFQEWRYGHDKASLQLACLENAVAAWRGNAQSERLIGDINTLQPRIAALAILAEELRDLYKAATGTDKVEEDLVSVGERLHEIEKLFKSGESIDKKALGIERQKLAARYDTLHTLVCLLNPNPESFLTLEREIDRAIGRTPYEEMKLIFGEAKKIVNAPEVKNLERVTVLETDSPERLFDIGRTPVQSCQRWNELTSYNKCLLAYIADANKKLYQVLDEDGNVIIRSVVRLLPFDKESPMLFVERPYAKRWTRDYGRVLFAQIAQRALEINEALGEPIAVATNDPRIEEIMDDFVKQYDSKLHKKKYSRKLPESKNQFEYSDSFGGLLESGASVNRQLKYIFIASE